MYVSGFELAAYKAEPFRVCETNQMQVTGARGTAVLTVLLYTECF